MKRKSLNKHNINWRKALNGISEGIIVVSPKYTIVDCNRTLCDLLKKKKRDVVGKKCYALIHGKNHLPKQCFLRSARRQNKKLEMELWEPYLKKQLYFTANCYFDKDDKFKYGVHVIKDISERKKVETMKDNLIRDVSHELKTPIAMVEMAYDMCERGIKAQDMKRIKKAQGIASDNLRRLHKDVNNILDMFALGRRKILEEVPSLSLRKIVDEIIQDVQYLLEDKKLKLKIDIPQRANGKIFVAEKEIRSLLTNIIDNAIKFTERGSISISSNLIGKWIRIIVKDTGCGIALKDKDKIFDRFYQRHAAIPGTGLGLSICKEIVEMYNCKIAVLSKGIGKGTAVVVTLPAR